MPTISLCMIVKNEEDVLARCLDSAAELVDEIVIVDTGSEDKTVEIAKRYTNKVYEFQWIDDFSAARNFSFSKATKDFCMWLDADDVIEEAQQKLFLQLKRSLSLDVDVVMMKYNTAFDEAGNPVFSYNRERLIKNNGTYFWKGQVHEAIAPEGRIVYAEVGVSHKKIGAGDPDRNLNIYRKMIADQIELEPRHQYYYARELYYHKQYQEALNVFFEFLGDPDGWVENKIEACRLCYSCYQELGMEQEALNALFISFALDKPRAEVCCDIARHFFDKENYENSIYWYERALGAEKRPDGGGFMLPDCYDYLPFIQICVCYDKLGDQKRAQEYNELAGACKPESKAYQLNKQYFASKMGN
ncbi:MAG: tetratricopeptide repeat-containing glycosyltransferase family 2 protein [Lachnospiraceae bacterium]